MSRKKHDTTPVAEAAELAHGLLGEDDAKPVSETRADWIEVLADTPAPDSRHIFSPAVGNLVCERIAAGETLNKIASEPGMPSRSTIDRWCTDRPEFKRPVQLRACSRRRSTSSTTRKRSSPRRQPRTKTGPRG